MVYLRNLGYNETNLPDLKNNRENLLGTPFVPYDGLNEKGVAIGMMSVPEAKAPFDPAKVTIGEIQLIRLVLDYAKDLNEAISLIQDYNIEMQTPPIHYLIADASGHSAVVEFVGGKMIVIRNNEPWQVSTNFVIHGTRAPEFVSCVRYNRAYASLHDKRGNISKEYAMGVLNQVHQTVTRWSTVYCMNTGEISIAVGNKYDSVRKFSLKMNGMPKLHKFLFLNPTDS
jgi:predicted choloylglycine hydrolase